MKKTLSKVPVVADGYDYGGGSNDDVEGEGGILTVRSSPPIACFFHHR